MRLGLQTSADPDISGITSTLIATQATTGVANMKDHHGRTPLLHTCQVQYNTAPEFCEVLKTGADMTSNDCNGWSPPHVCSRGLWELYHGSPIGAFDDVGNSRYRYGDDYAIARLRRANAFASDWFGRLR